MARTAFKVTVTTEPTGWYRAETQINGQIHSAVAPYVSEAIDSLRAYVQSIYNDRHDTATRAADGYSIEVETYGLDEPKEPV